MSGKKNLEQKRHGPIKMVSDELDGWDDKDGFDEL